jgi:DNA-binding MarR family transcriptional regulator
VSQATNPVVSPAYQLWLASNAWQRAVRRVLDPLDLTHVQFVILAAVSILESDEEPVTQAKVCRFGALDENMTSQVVKNLTDKGLLSRERHPHDGRAYVLSLTPSGEDLTTRARAAVRPVTAAFFEPLGSRAADLASMLSELTEDAPA